MENFRFNKFEIEEILELYSKRYSVNQIGRKFKIRNCEISKILKENGVEVEKGRRNNLQKYTLNDSYFKKVDTSEKSYILGFLYADGGVDFRSSRISLNINDVELLYDISRCINLQGKELYKNPSHENAMTLLFTSREMKKDLINLGCTPRKSLQ